MKHSGEKPLRGIRKLAADLIVARPAPRRLVLAHFASVTGDFMVIASMPFVVVAMGGSLGEVGLIFAVQTAALALLLPVGGLLGDRLPRRSLMISADLIRSAVQITVAGLLAAGDASIGLLLIAQTISGGATGLFLPSSEAIIRDVVEESEIQTTFALREAGASLAKIGGPALGGLAVSVFGPELALAADASTFAISAAAVLGVAPVVARSSEAKSMLADLAEGWTIFRSCDWLRSVVFQFAVVNGFVLAPFVVLGPIVARDSLGGAGSWAAILSAMAIGELGGAAVAGSWHPRRPLLAGVVGSGLLAIPLALLAAAAPLPIIAAGAAIGGAGVTAFAVFWGATLQRHLPAEQLGRITAFDQFGSLAIVPIGFLCAGMVQRVTGAEVGLLAAAVLAIAAAAAVVLVPGVRHLGTRPVADRLPDFTDPVRITKTVAERELAAPEGAPH